MTNIQKTSLFAYDSIKTDLNRRQWEVFDVIEYLGEVSAKEVAQKLGLKINQITGRINELMFDKQAIKIIKRLNNQSYYGVRYESDPLNVRKLTSEEKLQKYRSWLKARGHYVAIEEAVEMLNKIISL